MDNHERHRQRHLRHLQDLPPLPPGTSFPAWPADPGDPRAWDEHRNFWRRLRRDLRLYYGAHLHRRLFLWFGAATLITAVAVGLLVHHFGQRLEGHPFRALLFFGIPLFVVFVGSGKVARRLARPIYELSQVAKDIGGGNLKARARLSHRLRPTDEISALAHSINDMADRIERQLADQRELLAAVSHELRTPLGHLRLLAELVRQNAGEKLGDQVDREILEMDRLVGELLAGARVDFQAIERRPLDAVETVRRALERAGLPAQLLVHEAPTLALNADPTLLARALANLLDNGRKHGGGVTQMAVHRDAGGVLFSVADAGPGITPGDEAKVFQPFHRREHSEGLGLGLSLVRKIAEAHGGRATATNRSGGGCTVSLWLPDAG